VDGDQYPIHFSCTIRYNWLYISYVQLWKQYIHMYIWNVLTIHFICTYEMYCTIDNTFHMYIWNVLWNVLSIVQLIVLSIVQYISYVHMKCIVKCIVNCTIHTKYQSHVQSFNAISIFHLNTITFHHCTSHMYDQYTIHFICTMNTKHHSRVQSLCNFYLPFKYNYVSSLYKSYVRSIHNTFHMYNEYQIPFTCRIFSCNFCVQF